MTRNDQPDHTEDPRGRDTGAGYPEEEPGGAQPGVERDDEGDRGTHADRPARDGGRDGDPGQATGNPNAAG
jgi:hypothetical protein